MSEQVVDVPTIPQPAAVPARGRTTQTLVLGAMLGLLAGLGTLGVVFDSLVMGVFGAVGGAVAGLIGAAMSLEPHGRHEDLEV